MIPFLDAGARDPDRDRRPPFNGSRVGARMTDRRPSLADPWHVYRFDPVSFGTTDSRVHVWRIGLDSTNEPVGANLSAEEAAQAERLKHRDGRRRFVAVRSVLRMILADMLGAAEDPEGSTLRVGYGAAGKPFLVNDPQLHFNVSHSDELAVIAVTRVGEVGIDVERQSAMADRDDIARLVFNGVERATLLACPAEERDRVFHRFWTRKEALLKAMGVGLPGIADPDAPTLTEAATAWRVTSLPHLEGHAAALARPRAARGLRLWSWPASAADRRAERRAGFSRSSPRPEPG